MTKGRGFTLIELFIVLAVLGILLSAGLPTFSRIVARTRLRSAVSDCVQSLQFARMQAVMHRRYISIANRHGKWQTGWTIFVDANANGFHERGERKLRQHPPLSSQIKIIATKRARRHIIYAPSGRSRQPNGGFLAGSLYFCPADKSLRGYRLVLNSVGRIRTERIKADSRKCRT